MKGLGPEVKPFTKDCPLKCSHAIPYGNASWCETFKNYEPSMKLDVIKKNNLCRRCLSNWQAPHLPTECRAPTCGKCKGDHHTIICPKPTGMQVMAAAIIEEDTETIPDIYGNGGVFDDIDQQVMMVSTHEDATKKIDGLTSQDTEELGQYYVGSSESHEYYEDEIIIEDTAEPFNCFSVNFVEDTLQTDTIGMYAGMQETSGTNQPTEEITIEEDRKRSKDIMGELKSDATKPTERKIPGGPLTGNASDSLRNNDSYKAGSKPGQENIKGAFNDKVNTISQADGNSE